MLNKKLILLDMDGTTYEKNDGILEENILVINETIKKGNEVCFVTGRPYKCEANDYSWIEKKTKMLYAFYNGSLIIDLDSKKILSKKTLSKETSLKIFKLLENTETILVFFPDDWDEVHCKLEAQTNELLMKQIKVTPQKWVKNFEITNYYKILALNLSLENANKIAEMNVNIFYNPKSKAAEINPKGINKGFVANFLTTKLNIDEKNVYCVGDSYNDLEMFKVVKKGISLDNSIEELKFESVYVSKKKYNEGGIVDIFENYININ